MYMYTGIINLHSKLTMTVPFHQKFPSIRLYITVADEFKHSNIYYIRLLMTMLNCSSYFVN